MFTLPKLWAISFVNFKLISTLEENKLVRICIKIEYSSKKQCQYNLFSGFISYMTSFIAVT